MRSGSSNTKMLTKLMFRLLPVQILLAAVGAVNDIVSSFFAANLAGVEAMSAVGLYGPIGMLATSISTILVGGSATTACPSTRASGRRSLRRTIL